MDEVASDAVLDLAYDWLRERRKESPYSADAWDVLWVGLSLRSFVAVRASLTEVR